ncbi:MAG: hypothetical protein K9W45_06040 [Candidatus Heimdallarchaeum aukensis]|uniref:RNase NYN domain-containing protein n=1 Tax=Candidatus Heimdallarchaeum aukensis TaxID=2876573 RepID=A0A9Y1BMY5_9ARCH|nr:MAG: hypothetical protein K9W45_06040 [Candidatus Heimdallarchaeum aukensis]
MKKKLVITLSILTFFMFSSFLISSPMSNSEVIVSQEPVSNYYNFSEKSEVNFTLSLNSSVIKRGINDLILFFHLSWLNGSPIDGDATIFYNISYETANIIENKHIVSNSSTDYVVKINKKDFYSQPAGNYSVESFVNGTNVITTYQTAIFTLEVLPSGQIEMTFVNNKIILKRNSTTEVDFQLVNVGGTAVTNVTISALVNRQGTEASPIIYLPYLNLMLNSGESYKGTIRFFTNEPLYQKHSYQVSFTNLDDPDNPVIVLSEPLYIICYPNISISNVHFSVNASLNKDYSITYNIANFEDDVVYIEHEITCPLIAFSEVNGEIFAISPSFSGHHIILKDKPIEAGNTTITLSIQIAWEIQPDIYWFTSFYFSGVFHIQIISNDEPLNPFDKNITIIILLITVLLGIGYFSRDIIKGLVKITKGEQERIFPETTYPYDVVIVDGSNVAWEEKDAAGHPKLANIEAMINKLSRSNFKKIITVADAALRYQIDNQRRLDQLVKEGAIKMLPARVDGDKFILRIAEEETAMIVSNDLFKEFREIAPWIDKRRIPFTILDGEVFLHPTAETPEDDISDMHSVFEN